MVSESEKLIKDIRAKAAAVKRQLRFMELCGTHSQSIAANGLKSLMPLNSAGLCEAEIITPPIMARLGTR